MITVHDRRALIRDLAAAPDRLIAIDGWYASGKSWLGRTAANCTGRRWVDLDKLVRPDRQAFVDEIDLQALQGLLSENPVILSGVCMREVLARLASPTAIHVYVKRMHHGYWTHEGEAEGRGSEIDKVCPPSALEQEVRRYHKEWRPHTRAHYLYERTVNAVGR